MKNEEGDTIVAALREANLRIDKLSARVQALEKKWMGRLRRANRRRWKRRVKFGTGNGTMDRGGSGRDPE